MSVLKVEKYSFYVYCYFSCLYLEKFQIGRKIEHDFSATLKMSDVDACLNCLAEAVLKKKRKKATKNAVFFMQIRKNLELSSDALLI